MLVATDGPRPGSTTQSVQPRPAAEHDARRHMFPIRRLALIGVVASVAGFTGRIEAAPQELPLNTPPCNTIPDGSGIKSYAAAAEAIVCVMVSRFQLPAPHGKLLIYATREEYEQGLIEYLKIDPALAHSTARFSKSSVGSCNVLVNEPAIAEETWPQRTELLAHELTHSVQLGLANRCGLARPQWMIEGTAEWMAFNVTSALHLDELSDVRVRLKNKVRGLNGKLPEITRLLTFRQWVNAREKYGFDGTYSLSFLVTDFLVERHSFSQVAKYFGLFSQSSDHQANFQQAFGESVEDFERALDAYLAETLK